MKKFTEQINKRFEQVTPQSVNDNSDQWIDAFNGGLDNQNLPINVVENTKLKTTTGTVASVGDCTVTKWFGQTQSYGHVRALAGEEGGINDFLAIASINLTTDSWNLGWNPLSNWIDDAYLDLELQEGMITGSFNANWFYGLQTFNDSGGASAVWGENWWIRWGLFQNGVLIAETGNAYPRAENTCVPFKVPCGSQLSRFDLRWQALTDNPEPGVMNAPTDKILSLIQIFGFGITVNNTFK